MRAGGEVGDLGAAVGGREECRGDWGKEMRERLGRVRVLEKIFRSLFSRSLLP